MKNNYNFYFLNSKPETNLLKADTYQKCQANKKIHKLYT